MNELQIKDQDIANALGVHTADLNDLADQLNLTLGEHYKYLHQGKQKRIYLIPGLKIIYTRLSRSRNKAVASRLRCLIEKKQEQHLKAHVDQVILENCQSLVTINNYSYISVHETIRILKTDHKTFRKILEIIRTSQKPLEIYVHFRKDNDQLLFSIMGILKIAGVMADYLTNPYRKKWCNTVEINVQKLLPILGNSTRQQAVNKAKEQAKERDKKTCQISGASEINGQNEVDVHHLYSAKDYPKLADSLDNLLTISKNLHKEFHQWLGGTGQACTVDDLIRFVVQLYPEYVDSLIILNQFRTRLHAPYPPVPIS